MSEHTKSSYNTQPAGLEKWLDETYKKLPVQLPEGARKWLADNAWWLTLLGGILALWGAWGFWQTGHYVSDLARWADQLSRATGGTGTSTDLGVMWYLALASLVVEGVLYLMAFSSLKEHKKSGWNLLFYASLVGVVMGVLQAFVPGYGMGSLVGVVIGVVIGWFVLFQVRSKFTH